MISRCRGPYALALIAALWASPVAAQQQTAVHGADSIFVSPAVKLAWAVRRGASEVETLVAVRIIASDASFRVIRVDGVDPFSKDRKVFVAARPLDRTTDLTIPRAQFADHPSTEIRFFQGPDDVAADRPKFTVFYLGVPDTTPEFPTLRDVEAYWELVLGQAK